MKKLTVFFILAVFAFLNVGEVKANRTGKRKGQQETLIQSGAVGFLKLGMTVAAARKVLKGFTLKRGSDGDGVALIVVSKGRTTVLTIYAGEENPESRINERAKIEQIEVWSEGYHTAAGVRPKMEISEVEKKYGKLKEIVTSEIESREYATFAKQPKGLSFRVEGSENTAGDYKEGKRETTKYTPKARLVSIIVN